jgi:TonB family protein
MRGFESWVIEYLANSIWIVPLIFCASWVAARAMRRVSTAAEHSVWVAALALEVVLPGLHITPTGLWGRLLAAARPVMEWWAGLWGHRPVQGDVQIIVLPAAAHVNSGLGLTRVGMTIVAAVYVCVVLYFALRLLWGLWKTSRVVREAEPIEDGAVAERWVRHTCAAGVEGARLLLSAEMNGPATVGIRRPALLVPVGFFEEMEAQEIDALMAHECAHMRRWDFAKNMLYSVLVLPASYHPAMWATWSRMSSSREMVCDELAAAMIEGRERYARALLRLAAWMIDRTPAKTIHAIGIFDANSLEGRIMQLTKKSKSAGRAVRAAMVAVCVTIGVATCASAMALRMEVNAEKSAAPSSAVKVPSGVIAAMAISQKHPVYPQEAKDKHIQGAVVLKAIIGKEGAVQNLQLVSGPEELRASTLDAVKNWQYKPYLLNGEPTEVETTITVTYSLEK